MRNAETVTFGGSGLDRAAARRQDEPSLRADPNARVTPFWRGKPLLQDDPESGALELTAVKVDHPALRDAGQWVFLGAEGDTPRFAADLSAWEPADLPETLGAFLDETQPTERQADPKASAWRRSTYAEATPRSDRW